MSRPAVDFPTSVCFSASAVNGANGRFGSEAASDLAPVHG